MPSDLPAGLGRLVDVIHVVLAAWSSIVLDSSCLPAIVVFRPDDDDLSHMFSDAHVVGESHPRALHHSETYRTMTA